MDGAMLEVFKMFNVLQFGLAVDHVVYANMTNLWDTF